MSKSVPIEVTPAVLIWARQSAGFKSVEQAAEAAGIDAQRLQQLESGAERPGLSEARKLAATYHRPLAVFLLSEPPRDFQPLRDYRTTDVDDDPAESRAFLLEVSHLRAWRDATLELYELAGEQPPTFALSARPSESAEMIAERLRAALRVSASQQSSWRDGFQALREWRRASERLGVLTFQFHSIPIKVARGVAIAETPLPIVAVNMKDAPTARCFSLLHEVAHLMLREDSRCVPGDRRPSERSGDVEALCNAVAAATLVPRAQLDAHDGVETRRDWPDAVVADLARNFQVSEESMLLRLVALGYATWDFYFRKRPEFLERYARLRVQQKEGESSGNYYRTQAARMSPGHSDLAIGLYRQGRMGLTETSRFLDVPPHGVERFASMLTSGAGA